MSGGPIGESGSLAPWVRDGRSENLLGLVAGQPLTSADHIARKVNRKPSKPRLTFKGQLASQGFD